MRAFAIGLLSAGLLSAAPVSAATITLNTADHPVQSTFTLTLQVAGTTFESSIGPTPMNGTMVVDLNLDGSNNGTVEILSADLDIVNIGPTTLNLGPFGTLDAEFDGLHLSMNTGVMNVAANLFTLNASVSGNLGIDAGILIATNATGFLGSALGSDPDDIDLEADPAIADYTDLAFPVLGFTDNSPANQVNGPEISFVTRTVVDVGSGILLITDARFMLGAPVPEVGTASMMGILFGTGGLGYLVRRRFRRS